MSVSGFFDRGPHADDRIVRSHGVRFRDTDPRPLGLDALIPTRPPVASVEDERLIESLAAYLAMIDPAVLRTPIDYRLAIRAWRDGAR